VGVTAGGVVAVPFTRVKEACKLGGVAGVSPARRGSGSRWFLAAAARGKLSLLSWGTKCLVLTIDEAVDCGARKEGQVRGEGMTQTDLVKALAEANGLSTAQAKGLIVTLAELAVKEVKESGVFVMPGIGRLVRVDRAARTGRNPATGEAIQIAAKQVMKFRVAKAAKDAIVPVTATKKAAKKKRYADQGEK